jgi:AraC-like DNA-binding protein
MSIAEVRTVALSGWIDRTSDFGVDNHAALHAAGLAFPFQSCERDFIPLSSFVRMTEYVGNHANHRAASWLIGEGYDLIEMGEIGRALLNAKTLGGALRRLTDNFELLQDSSHLRLDIGADTATISYRIFDPSIWPRHQDALFSLGIVAKVIKLAVCDALDAAELGFECHKRDIGLNMAQSQLSFDCDANSITIPIAMLNSAMPDNDMACDLPTLSRHLNERRRTLSAQDRLTSLIFARLSDGEINQEQLARDVGMSSRTMRRRLSQDETSFQQLLDDCRMRQAVLEFQSRPSASIAQIALRLGYAEHSTFTRAFTRWAGIPPQRFRAGLSTTTH